MNIGEIVFSRKTYNKLKKLNKDQLITLIWKYVSEFVWDDDGTLEEDILEKIEAIKAKGV